MAIDDEVVVGYPVEKVLFLKTKTKTNGAVKPPVVTANVCLCVSVWLVLGSQSCVAVLDKYPTEEKRLFGSSSIFIFYFAVKAMLSYFLLSHKFGI